MQNTKLICQRKFVTTRKRHQYVTIQNCLRKILVEKKTKTNVILSSRKNRQNITPHMRRQSWSTCALGVWSKDVSKLGLNTQSMASCWEWSNFETKPSCQSLKYYQWLITWLITWECVARPQPKSKEAYSFLTFGLSQFMTVPDSSSIFPDSAEENGWKVHLLLPYIIFLPVCPPFLRYTVLDCTQLPSFHISVKC